LTEYWSSGYKGSLITVMYPFCGSKENEQQQYKTEIGKALYIYCANISKIFFEKLIQKTLPKVSIVCYKNKSKLLLLKFAGKYFLVQYVLIILMGHILNLWKYLLNGS
jgi:hypothetical protein